MKKNQKGFTIIEVLIVLAIAGLILLIVFLAVPALQRNSRNTQYRNDVASYLGATSEWSTNNNGRVPGTDDLDEILALAKLGTMDPPTAVVAGARTADVAIGTIELVTGAKCDPDNVGNTVASTSRAFAVRFSVESSGADIVPQCQES